MGTGSRLVHLSEDVIIKLLLSCGPPDRSDDYTLKFVAAREALGIHGLDLTVGRWRYVYMTWKAEREFTALTDAVALEQMLKELEEMAALRRKSQSNDEEIKA